MKVIEEVPGTLVKGIQIKRFKEKEIQIELLINFDNVGHRRLRCNTDHGKTAALFNQQEQMVETRGERRW